MWHPSCMTTRVFSKRFAQKSGLGDDWAAAYLGVWLRDGCSCSSAETHKDVKPSVEEVQAYARAVFGIEPA